MLFFLIFFPIRGKLSHAPNTWNTPLTGMWLHMFVRNALGVWSTRYQLPVWWRLIFVCYGREYPGPPIFSFIFCCEPNKERHIFSLRFFPPRFPSAIFRHKGMQRNAWFIMLISYQRREFSNQISKILVSELGLVNWTHSVNESCQ